MRFTKQYVLQIFNTLVTTLRLRLIDFAQCDFNFIVFNHSKCSFDSKKDCSLFQVRLVYSSQYIVKAYLHLLFLLYAQSESSFWHHKIKFFSYKAFLISFGPSLPHTIRVPARSLSLLNVNVQPDFWAFEDSECFVFRYFLNILIEVVSTRQV